MVYRVLKRLFLLSLLAGWSSLPALAEQENISVTFDLTATNAVLELFDAPDPTKDDVAALLQHPAVKATIVQTGRFDKRATEEAYVGSLWAILQNKRPDDDPFNFQGVRDRLDGIRAAVRIISKQQESLSRSVGLRIAEYTPADIDIETTLYAVLGGTSDGWAPGNGNFYLALQYFRDDVPGLTSMVVHEVYHVAQEAFLSQTADESQTRAARSLVRNVLAEGSATLVGNPENFQGDGSYLKFLQDKHSRNLARIEENFALFETLYFRAMKDPEVTFSQLYSLGFSGNWDSPLYFVGFHIAEGLERHLGRVEFVNLLAESSGREVLAEYIRIYTESGDPKLLQFTPTTESMVFY